jgi:hypothetical protein
LFTFSRFLSVLFCIRYFLMVSIPYIPHPSVAGYVVKTVGAQGMQGAAKLKNKLNCGQTGGAGIAPPKTMYKSLSAVVVRIAKESKTYHNIFAKVTMSGTVTIEIKVVLQTNLLA